MCSHFVNLIDRAVKKLNQKPTFTPVHHYFGAKLQDTISVKTLYDTGADISCISSQTFHRLPPIQHLIYQPSPSPSCQGANRHSLHTLGVYLMKIQIGGHAIDHPFQVTQGLDEDALVGIDFIHKHKNDPQRAMKTVFIRKPTQMALWATPNFQGHLSLTP
jgi:gag-polyprotein putative aspartyl protease